MKLRKCTVGILGMFSLTLPGFAANADKVDTNGENSFAWDVYFNNTEIKDEEMIQRATWWKQNDFTPDEALKFERIAVSTNRAIDFLTAGMSFADVQAWVTNQATKNLDADEIKKWCSLNICTPAEVQTWLASVRNVYEAKLYIKNPQRVQLSARPLQEYGFSKSGMYIERY